MIYTEEQKEIIYSNQDNIIVDSKAGSGKTSTLKAYAKENFHLRILYLVFNKDLRKTFIDKFTLNVDVHTINSFFYASYNGKIKDSYDVLDIQNILKCNLDDAFIILNDLKFFLKTGLNQSKDILKFCNKVIEKNYIWDQDFLLRFCKIDPMFLNYDVIMFDEAQDINPAALQIIEQINPKKVIFIGDVNQSIYGFNNSINVFDIYSDYSKYYLNKTFRFGLEISNHVQSKLDIQISPNEKINSKIVNTPIIGPESYYICRTNFHLFEKALEYAFLDYSVSIPFDWEELESLLLGVFYLKLGVNKSLPSVLKPFKSFDDFEKAIKMGYKQDLKYIYKIILKYDIHILEYIKIIRNKLSSSKFADISLITAHKSKGLEFMHVEIAPDFRFNNQEERNLYYVAATRAILELKVN